MHPVRAGARGMRTRRAWADSRTLGWRNQVVMTSLLHGHSTLASERAGEAMVALEEMRDGVVTHYDALIDGNAVEALSGRRLDVIAPSDGRVFATIPRGGSEDIDRAV